MYIIVKGTNLVY